MNQSTMKTAGFTIVELIATLIITGILALAVYPRFVNRQTFDTRGFHDQTLAMLRYGQKVAIAQRTSVFFNTNATGTTLCLTYVANPTCNTTNAVLHPADRAPFIRTVPSGVTVTASVAFSFSALGKPSPDSAVAMSVNGDGVVRAITVERETGYVH